MDTSKTLTNTKSRIMDAAFETFIQHGYEGASLSVIAEKVNIRKASIYTHFSSKDALFLSLLEHAFQLESEYVDTCFSQALAEMIPGEAYCLSLKTRYLEQISFRFLMRMAYFPPQHLLSAVQEKYLSYIQILSTQVQRGFEQLGYAPEKIELYSDAYLGILDSLSVELLYGELFYERRLKAMMFLYRQSFTEIKS